MALTLPAAVAENESTSGKTEGAPESNRAPNPNDIVGAGLFMFVVSYVPATMIAESSTARADRLLYVPVAGPWLDLARRPVCNGACNSEFGNRALLATDGMLQDVGILMTLVGLLSDGAAAGARTANIQARSERKVHVSPANFGGGGYGISASGRF